MRCDIHTVAQIHNTDPVYITVQLHTVRSIPLTVIVAYLNKSVANVLYLLLVKLEYQLHVFVVQR